MSWIRESISRFLDFVDPPKKRTAATPCPACDNDVSNNYTKAQGQKDDLIYFLCPCGHASAWYWSDYGPQLVYGSVPKNADNEDDDLLD